MTTGSRPSGRTTVNSRQWRPLRQTAQRRPARSITATSSGSTGFTLLTTEDRHSGPVTGWVTTQPQHRRAEAPGPQHVAATAFIDAGRPDVRAFAQRPVAGGMTDRARISRLFTAVRDQIRYDPYQLSYDRHDYVASNVIGRGAAFLIPTAVLLTAAARSLGIPACLGSRTSRTICSPPAADMHGHDGAVPRPRACAAGRARPIRRDGRADRAVGGGSGHPAGPPGRIRPRGALSAPKGAGERGLALDLEHAPSHEPRRTRD
jgi:transglutaminase-like putative cysteine protease